jgi:hypothetical protein
VAIIRRALAVGGVLTTSISYRPVVKRWNRNSERVNIQPLTQRPAGLYCQGVHMQLTHIHAHGDRHRRLSGRAVFTVLHCRSHAGSVVPLGGNTSEPAPAACSRPPEIVPLVCEKY